MRTKFLNNIAGERSGNDLDYVWVLVEQTNDNLKENHSELRITADDLIWNPGPNFDWGMKSGEPVRKVPFHTKGNEWTYKTAKAIAATAPSSYFEKGIRLYVTIPAAENEAKMAFDTICKDIGIATRCTSQEIIPNNSDSNP